MPKTPVSTKGALHVSELLGWHLNFPTTLLAVAGQPSIEECATAVSWTPPAKGEGPPSFCRPRPRMGGRHPSLDGGQIRYSPKSPDEDDPAHLPHVAVPGRGVLHPYEARRQMGRNSLARCRHCTVERCDRSYVVEMERPRSPVPHRAHRESGQHGRSMAGRVVSKSVQRDSSERGQTTFGQRASHRGQSPVGRHSPAHCTRRRTQDSVASGGASRQTWKELESQFIRRVARTQRDIGQ